MKKSKASDIAILSLLVALIIVIQFLSSYVYQVWPIPVQPTLASIPVIVGACILGWRKGAILGFFMGLILFVQASMTAGPTNFLFTPVYPVPGTHSGSFWAIIITFVPRILIGVFAGLVYKIGKSRVTAGIAGFVGAITNTIFVLGFMYLFFGTVLKMTFGQLLGMIIAGNSIVEVIAAVILTAAIVPALEKNRH
ncbi:ECF transporter S component [Lactovum odontotermitis]